MQERRPEEEKRPRSELIQDDLQIQPQNREAEPARVRRLSHDLMMFTAGQDFHLQDL